MIARILNQGKRIFLTLAALAALAFSGTAHAQQLPQSTAPPGESARPKPRLMIQSAVYEAGDIEPGALVRHEFAIANEGNAPLEITEVKPGCGCAAAMFDRVIPPGATGAITISVKVYPEWAGQTLRKTAWVLTNDPVSPQVRLVISGRVKGAPAETPEAAVSPSSEPNATTEQ